eukprot:jgi/Tetstr1/457624/TSEL_044191.t1
MLHVVGSRPPKYVSTAARIRELCRSAPPGFYTRADLGRTESQHMLAIGNVWAGKSVSVMLRIAVAWAHQRLWESYVATLSMVEPAKRAAVQAAERRLRHAMRQRGEAELDLHGAALQTLELLFQKKRRGKTQQENGVKLMSKARQRGLHKAEAQRREAGRKAAKVGEKAARPQRGLRPLGASKHA